MRDSKKYFESVAIFSKRNGAGKGLDIRSQSMQRQEQGWMRRLACLSERSPPSLISNRGFKERMRLDQIVPPGRIIFLSCAMKEFINDVNSAHAKKYSSPAGSCPAETARCFTSGLISRMAVNPN